MGIPSYFSYIIKNHSNIIKQYNSIKNISNFYLDSNSIIYDALKNIDFQDDKVKFEKNIINWVIKKIEELIKIIKPKNTILIAFDGVAPMAKLQQQKTRRFKSMYINKILQKMAIDNDLKWDKAAITPGTTFMKNLGKSLIKKFSKNKKVIVSTTEEAGEGEHKIFDFIRNHPEKHYNKTTIVYGLDADLIMLCLNNLQISNDIYIYRETPEFIKSLNYNLEPNVLYCMDIVEFSKAIVKEMGFNNKHGNCVISDYIFICFLLGNDFMPHFPSLNIRTTGINILIAAYHNTISSQNKVLIHDGNIQWKNFKNLIKWLADSEKNNLIEEYAIRKKWEKRIYNNSSKEEILKKIDNIPTKMREIEILIDPYNKGWENRYYTKLFDSEPNEYFINKLCTNYLEGLEWVYRYYTKGCCDWNWKYNYHYPPLFKDLLNYIPYWDTNMIEDNDNKPIPPIVQLAYVLPSESFEILPNKIKNILIKKYSDFYLHDPNIHWSFCKYFWEAHIDFIDVNMDKFIQDING